jgi:hypothetical protein
MLHGQLADQLFESIRRLAWFISLCFAPTRGIALITKALWYFLLKRLTLPAQH